MAARDLLEPEALHGAIERIGKEISNDYPDGALLVAVLKGSVVFLADLVRAIPTPVEVDFLAISRFAPDTGRVRIIKDLDAEVTDVDVILVEDIVDTGLASTFLRRHVEALEPRSVRICTLLDRVQRRIVPVEVHYRGFEIDEEFVLGYGLDFEERYRNLNRIVVGDVRALAEDANHHVRDLYGTR